MQPCGATPCYKTLSYILLPTFLPMTSKPLFDHSRDQNAFPPSNWRHSGPRSHFPLHCRIQRHDHYVPHALGNSGVRPNASPHAQAGIKDITKMLPSRAGRIHRFRCQKATQHRTCRGPHEPNGSRLTEGTDTPATPKGLSMPNTKRSSTTHAAAFRATEQKRVAHSDDESSRHFNAVLRCAATPASPVPCDYRSRSHV